MLLKPYTDVRARTLAGKNWHDSSYDSESEAGKENCHGGRRWPEDKGPSASNGENPPQQADVKGSKVWIMLLAKYLPQRELGR